MKSLIIANVCLYFLALSSAAVFRGFYNDTDYPGKCVMKEFDFILSPGDIVQFPNGCGRLLCYENSLIVGHSCGVYGPPPGCIVGEPIDAKAPYPDCCIREFICNNIE